METLTTENRDAVTLVRFARSRRRNAINMALLKELDEVLRGVELDESVRALVLTGDERAFSAGQDLKEPEPPDFVATINAVFDRLEALPVPTIAAVDGACVAGGLELALACDMRVASEDAQIGDRHAPIGSIGGAGATVRLTRLLGPARAKELVFTGMVLSGPQARDLGLVSYAYPSAELIERAVEHARSMCAGDRLTIAHAKRSIGAAVDLSRSEASSFALVCQENLRARLDPDYGAHLGSGKSGERRES